MSSKTKSAALLARQRFEEETNRQLKDSFDPETLDLGADGSLLAGAKRTKRPRAAAEDDELDAKYSGTRISRRELMGQDNDSDSDLLGEDGDIDDMGDVLMDKESRAELQRVRDQLLNERDEDDDESDQDSASDDDELVDESEDDIDITEHIDDMKQSDNEILSNVQKQKQQEQKKAKAVFSQKLLFDHLLKLRILVQKPLNAANRLPQHDVFDEFVANGLDEQGQQSLGEVQSALTDTLQDLVQLQCQLLGENTSISQANAGGKLSLVEGDEFQQVLKRRKLEDGAEDPLWKALESNYSAFRLYREDSLERWNSRTRLQSIQGKELKTLNMGIMKRVEMALRDKDGLIRKTQQKRFDERILGKRQREEEPAAAAASSETYDSELFDDRDFYQKLLRDLIEDVGTSVLDHTGKGASSLNASLKEALAKRAQQSRDKSKQRQIDLGKTKGRTIKYTVHSKMVNFMAPQEKEIPETAQALFSNLFGGYWPVPRPIRADEGDDE